MASDVTHSLERFLAFRADYEARRQSRLAQDPLWLKHLVALSDALETGTELPPQPEWMRPPERPALTLIQGGRDTRGD